MGETKVLNPVLVIDVPAKGWTSVRSRCLSNEKHLEPQAVGQELTKSLHFSPLYIACLILRVPLATFL